MPVVKAHSRSPKTRWRLWIVPCGPEDRNTQKRCAMHDLPHEVLRFYELLRQSGGEEALAVTDQKGNIVYACS